MRRWPLVYAPLRADARGRVILVAAVAALAGVLTACSPGPPEDTGDYTTRIMNARAAKDAFLLSDPDSPVPAGRRDSILPLVYYPVDPDYSAPAALTPAPQGPPMMMQTSTGSQVQMLRVGRLNFTVKGMTLALTAFNEVGSPDLEHLFVPFKDLTNGVDTYGGGRFLDLERTATNIYNIDFNRAYNPNCYFDITWVCPIPPPENRLEVAITAGEKIREPAYE